MLEAALFPSAALRTTLLKPVVDAVRSRLQQRHRLRQRHSGEAALREAIRELLLPHPDERRVEARIALARASGAQPRDTALAEAMLERHRATRPMTTGKTHRSRRQRQAA
jgi:hypothetical protein